MSAVGQVKPKKGKKTDREFDEAVVKWTERKAKSLEALKGLPQPDRWAALRLQWKRSGKVVGSTAYWATVERIKQEAGWKQSQK